jgi:hypothetical protein
LSRQASGIFRKHCVYESEDSIRTFYLAAPDRGPPGRCFILLGTPATARAFTFTTIDVPGATSTEASGINPRGQIVGHFLDASGADHGFSLLRLTTLITIDVPGATSTEASGINPEGQIVGDYTDAAGTLHGFVAVP